MIRVKKHDGFEPRNLGDFDIIKQNTKERKQGLSKNIFPTRINSYPQLLTWRLTMKIEVITIELQNEWNKE